MSDPFAQRAKAVQQTLLVMEENADDSELFALGYMIPQIGLVQEMAELVSANRLYEANLSSIQAEKEMIKRSMEI